MDIEEKDQYKQVRSKSYATQRDGQQKINRQRASILASKEQNNSQTYISNNGFSQYSKMGMSDLNQRKRNLMNNIGHIETMDTQATNFGSTHGNQFNYPRNSSVLYVKNNSQHISQAELNPFLLQKSLPTTNFSTLPDSVYESVEAIYPQFKKKIVQKRNVEKSDYEKSKEEIIGRYKTELYSNDKFLYKSQQQLAQIEEQEQYAIFKKEIEIQEQMLKENENQRKEDLQIKKWPNIWKMVRHFQETKAQDVADMLKTKEFLDDIIKDDQVKPQQIDNLKMIPTSESQRSKGYAHSTLSSTNYVKNLLSQQNGAKKGQNNTQQNMDKSKNKQNIQSFLEKECKKAKMMAEELEIQQIFRNGINQNSENTTSFSDANKINSKIKKYCKLIRPTGASLSNRVDQKFVDNNMKYFLISSTIDMDQTQKIAMKQEFEKNKTLTHNFGNLVKQPKQSKVMEEYSKNLEKNTTDDYLNDNVILFPTEIDQILSQQEFQEGSSQQMMNSQPSKGGNYTESKYENNEKDAIQEEQLYDNLSTPPANSERRISIPKIINGRITLEVKSYIKKSLPQTKHYIHYRSRKDKRAISMNTNKFAKYDDQEAIKSDLICTKDYLHNTINNNSINKGSRYDTFNQSSLHQRSVSNIYSKQDFQRSQLQSRAATSMQIRNGSLHDTTSQFVSESQSKINDILQSCTKVKKEIYDSEIEREEYSKNKTVKDVIKAMEKLRDNKTEKIKTRLLNESELNEKNDIQMLAEGQKVLSYLEDQIDKSIWEKKVQDKELEYQKDLVRQKRTQSQNSNIVKVSQVTQIHKKKFEKSKIQQRCFIQSQEKQLSKYINFADYIGYK